MWRLKVEADLGRKRRADTAGRRSDATIGQVDQVVHYNEALVHASVVG